jgi:hypothetical protein
MSASDSLLGTSFDEFQAYAREIGIPVELVDVKATFERYRHKETGVISPEAMASVKLKTDVFLTHDWGIDELGRNNHDRVALVNRELKSAGFVTWFDSDRMTGDVVDQMVAGINNSSVVIVCITQRYMDKVNGSDANDNCRKEFKYAVHTKSSTKMIPVVMEPRMKNIRENWKNLVNFELGNILYVDFSNDNDFQSAIQQLKAEILCRSNPLWVLRKLPSLSMDNLSFSPLLPPPVLSSTSGSTDADLLMIGQMSSWFNTIGICSATAREYARILMGKNTGSVSKLQRKLERNVNYLEETGGFDEDDIVDIKEGLSKLVISPVPVRSPAAEIPVTFNQSPPSQLGGRNNIEAVNRREKANSTPVLSSSENRRSDAYSLKHVAKNLTPGYLQDLRIGETKKFFVFTSTDASSQLYSAVPKDSYAALDSEIVSMSTNLAIPGMQLEGILERQGLQYSATLAIRISDENLQYNMSLYGPAKLKLICCDIVVFEQRLQLKPPMKCLPFPFYVFQNAINGCLIVDREITISIKVFADLAETTPIFDREYTAAGSDWKLPADPPNGIMLMNFQAGTKFRNLSVKFINYLAEVNCGSSVELRTALPLSLQLSEASWKVFFAPADLVKEEWRVVLRWNSEPRDLDLHCKMNKKPFDVYFGSKNAGGRADPAKGKIELDVDVRNGFGPETITFTPLQDVNYRFFVSNYSGGRNRESGVPLSQSGATVTVYMGSDDVKTFSVGEDIMMDTEGSHAFYWNVFEIFGGEMRVVNQVVFDDLKRLSI